MSEPIAEMEKGPTEKIFFNLSEYKGKNTPIFAFIMKTTKANGNRPRRV